MAETMKFDLVSPEQRVASFEASAVRLPGADGDMTAMPGHAPVITSLRPGVVTVDAPGGNQTFVVSGGFAEITATSTTLLAEQAREQADVTPEFLEKLRKEAEAAHAKASPEAQDMAAKTLADLVHLAEAMV